MRTKISSILSLFVMILGLAMISQFVNAQVATAHCKCATECKCRINGICKCGSDCKCAQLSVESQCAVVENSYQCGTACRCKKDGNKSNCRCVNCKCHPVADPTHHMGAGEGHNHTASVNPFLQMMDEMMKKMDAVPLTGAVEYDFLTQMMPHHEGAITMAKYIIAHGKNNEMKQLAKSILAEQQGELMDMQRMLTAYSVGIEVNMEYKAAMDKTMQVMMINTPTDAQLPEDMDCCFAQVMLPHHQAALDMAVAVMRFNPQGAVAIYAQRIIGDQLVEIEQMKMYIHSNCKQ